MGMKENEWCPLTGAVEPNNPIIDRARALLGAKTIVKDNVCHIYRPDEEVIEKARRIYERLRQVKTEAWFLAKCDAAMNASYQLQGEYEEEVYLPFHGLGASRFEVFIILAICAARVADDPAFPLALLSFAEKHSPDALRGKAVYEGAKRAGAGKASQILDERKPVWDDWQARADAKLSTNPTLSKFKLGEKIKADLIREDPMLKVSSSTIRQRIKKR